MKKDGIAQLVIAMGSKGKGSDSEAPPKDEKASAAGDIWDAIKADDKEAFIDAVESYVAMCSYESGDDD